VANRGEGERLTAIVTGVGAPPAISIFKALRQSALHPRVVATDAEPTSVGLFRADAGYVIPRIRDGEEAYLDRLEAICRRERAAIVCFGSEEELRRVAPHARRIEERTGATPIVNAPHHLDTFLDKWGTFVALREKGLPVPDSVVATDADALRGFLARHRFPLVLKPRHGSGSKNLFRVKDADELGLLLRFVPEPVLQELLLPDDEEYTVGAYKSPRTGYVGQIVFRRSLAAGLTYKAEVVRDPEIEAVCREVVEAFDFWGPVNLQLRNTSAGVRVFEINLRFSSSAVMRAYFGFNEPELCLRDLVLGERLAAPEVRPGWALRYWDEVYVSEEEIARMRERRAISGPVGRKGDDF
jgi:carbamoyl-phosphate synthase large subunit